MDAVGALGRGPILAVRNNRILREARECSLGSQHAQNGAANHEGLAGPFAGASHLEVFLENVRVLNLWIVLAEFVRLLEVFCCAAMIAHLV